MQWLGGQGGAAVRYTGENGVIVNNSTDKISADFDVVQHKLTQGSNITISNNVISAQQPDVSQFVTGSEVTTQIESAIANVREVPASDSSDVNKVLTVDANGDYDWSPVPSGPSGVTDVKVDGTSVVTAGVANITMPTVSEVPAVTNSDNLKVLKASYQNNTGSYAWGYASAFVNNTFQTYTGGGGGTAKHTWTVSDKGSGSLITFNITDSDFYVHNSDGYNFHPFHFHIAPSLSESNLQDGQMYRFHLTAYVSQQTRGGSGPRVLTATDFFFVKQTYYIPAAGDFNVSGYFVVFEPTDIDYFEFEVYDMNGNLMHVADAKGPLPWLGTFSVGM